MQAETFGTRCVAHPWQTPLAPCAGCARVVCVLCRPVARERAWLCASCARERPQPEVAPAWESGRGSTFDVWLRTWQTAIRSTTHMFEHLPDGSIGTALYFACLCRVPAYVLAHHREAADGGPLAFLLGLLIEPLRLAATHMLLIGTAHWLLTRALTRRASWSLSLRAVGYAQALVLPLSLSQGALALIWGGSATPMHRSFAALITLWVGTALFHVARGRLRLNVRQSAAVALLSPLAPMLAGLVSGPWLSRLSRLPV